MRRTRVDCCRAAIAISGMTMAVAHSQSALTIGGNIDGGISYISNQRGARNVIFDGGILSPTC